MHTVTNFDEFSDYSNFLSVDNWKATWEDFFADVVRELEQRSGLKVSELASSNG